LTYSSEGWHFDENRLPNKRVEAPGMTDDEFPTQTDQALSIIEAELEGKHRQRPKHASHKEVHPLTAKEEAGRRGKSSKAKKYDGRTFSKNAVVSRQKVREALDSFYKEVKLPELKQALSISNDPRYNMLLAAINNPRFNGCSFAELCRKCRMSIQDVVEVWRNHLKTQGIVRMMGHMPDLMEDVAVDGKSKVVTCDLCQGKGRLTGQEVNKIKDPICPSCHGDGSIRINGDKDARLLAFETVGLRKSGGINNVNVMNFNKGVPSMEDQISNIDNVFDIPRDDIKEEVIDEGTISNNNPGNETGPGIIEGTGKDLGTQAESAHADLSTPNRQDTDYKPDPTDYSS
jgi:hypothetical protein